MPALIEHFVEHRQQNKQISLWQFLNIHYETENTRDADYDKDMKLPFKSQDNGVIANLNVYVPAERVSVDAPVQLLEMQNFVMATSFISSNFLSNIWQPPRTC
jgi:hypothetical protein